VEPFQPKGVGLESNRGEDVSNGDVTWENVLTYVGWLRDEMTTQKSFKGDAENRIKDLENNMKTLTASVTTLVQGLKEKEDSKKDKQWLLKLLILGQMATAVVQIAMKVWGPK
jgi:hypothetical protein